MLPCHNRRGNGRCPCSMTGQGERSVANQQNSESEKQKRTARDWAGIAAVITAIATLSGVLVTLFTLLLGPDDKAIPPDAAPTPSPTPQPTTDPPSTPTTTEPRRSTSED